MKFSRADDRAKIWRFRHVSATNPVSILRGTGLIAETSKNLHILTRLLPEKISLNSINLFNPVIVNFPDQVTILLSTE
jgi:hypothetical protein